MNKTLLWAGIIILFVGAFFVFNKDIKIKNNMDSTKVVNGKIEIIPVEHATMVMKWGGKIIYTDPVGGASAFANQPSPDLILLTDIHGDHLSIETLEAVSKAQTVIIAPMAVADKLPSTILGDLLVMKNGQKTNQKKVKK